MLEDYLQRQDVIDFMKRLKTSECYYQKNSYDLHNHSLTVSNELALYIFYDALLKFKIIVDDVDFFSDYLEQMERLYRKFDSFEDIRFGIHKLIAKTTSSKYDLHEWRGEEQEKLIEIIYDKYIQNGYYFHGFHSAYRPIIQQNGFVPEYYENYYKRFMKVNQIFEKYKIKNVIHKDFSDTKIAFTDNPLLGCYYSMYAPMFFTEFLTNSNLYGKKVQMDAYLKGDYDTAIQPLKKFMSNHSFREEDRKEVLDLVQDEWNFLHFSRKEICLLMIPRKQLREKEIPLENYMADDCDLFEIIDRILSSKCNSISTNDSIMKDDSEIVTLPDFYQEKIERKFVIEPEKEYDSSKENVMGGLLANAYGHVSLLLLAGSLSISFGVILSILTILGG